MEEVRLWQKVFPERQEYPEGGNTSFIDLGVLPSMLHKGGGVIIWLIEE